MKEVKSTRELDALVKEIVRRIEAGEGEDINMKAYVAEAIRLTEHDPEIFEAIYHNYIEDLLRWYMKRGLSLAEAKAEVEERLAAKEC